MTGKPRVEPLAILQGCDVFGGMPAPALKELAGRGRVQKFAQRTLLTAQNKVPELLYYVVEGVVELTVSSREGGVASLPILPGRWATWVGCFNPAPVSYEMWSSKQTVCVGFPCGAVRKAVAADPDALMKVIEQIAANMRFLIAWTLSASVLTPERRLAQALLEIASDRARGGEGEAAVVTQSQLAKLGLGTRQRVARLLRGLEGRGLVERRYGAVQIRSRRELGEFVG